jgi:hypothetical protein
VRSSIRITMSEGVWMNLKSKNDVVTAAGPSGGGFRSAAALL